MDYKRTCRRRGRGGGGGGKDEEQEEEREASIKHVSAHLQPQTSRGQGWRPIGLKSTWAVLQQDPASENKTKPKITIKIFCLCRT